MTELVSFAVPLQPIAALQSVILAQLEAQGQPLRWAITAIESDPDGNGKADRVRVEAVVLVVS
jgi:hypothetical protein